MVSAVVQRKADFLLEQAAAVEETARITRQARLIADRVLENSQALADDLSLSTEGSDYEQRPQHDDDNEGSINFEGEPNNANSGCAAATCSYHATGDESSNSDKHGPLVETPLSPVSEVRYLRKSVRACFVALRETQENASLKTRRLEAEVAYLRKTLSDAQAENSQLVIEKMSLAKLVGVESTPNGVNATRSDPARGNGTTTTKLRQQDLKLEKHLNSLLMARNQAVKENYLLKRRLLQTCFTCYERLGIGKRHLQLATVDAQPASPGNGACRPTWQNAAQQMVQKIANNSTEGHKQSEAMTPLLPTTSSLVPIALENETPSGQRILTKTPAESEVTSSAKLSRGPIPRTPQKTSRLSKTKTMTPAELASQEECCPSEAKQGSSKPQTALDKSISHWISIQRRRNEMSKVSSTTPATSSTTNPNKINIDARQSPRTGSNLASTERPDGGGDGPLEPSALTVSSHSQSRNPWGRLRPKRSNNALH